MSDWPETIYLLPGTGDDGSATWCDHSPFDDVEAVEYVRAPTVHPLALAILRTLLADIECGAIYPHINSLRRDRIEALVSLIRMLENLK